MSIGLIVILFVFGCFYIGQEDYEDVVQHAPETWNTRDCSTIIPGATQNNYADNIHNPNIRVFAMPYYPVVITAIEWREHLLGPLQYQPFTYKHTWETFRKRLDSMLAIEAGVFMDWSNGKYVDTRGNYLRDPTQLDFIMFYVSLQNVGWLGLTHLSDFMGQRWFGIATETIPDISNLENNIYLLNDKNDTLKPRYVYGKHRDYLTIEEQLHVTFILK